MGRTVYLPNYTWYYGGFFMGNCRVDRPVLWMLWDLWASEFCFRSAPLENTISGINRCCALGLGEFLRFFVASTGMKRYRMTSLRLAKLGRTETHHEPQRTDVPLFGWKWPETKFARHGKPQKWIKMIGGSRGEISFLQGGWFWGEPCMRQQESEGTGLVGWVP